MDRRCLCYGCGNRVAYYPDPLCSLCRRSYEERMK
jgi:predicted amidophosphoribosyltransferase